MKDPIVQATARHHTEEADRQRRYDALTEEIYADLPAHLNEIVEFTDTEKALRRVLELHMYPFASVDPKEIVAGSIDFIIGIAVKKIVERRLEE